ncbi:FliM/FliN family flagellar motor switch protein [Pseudomonas sp. KU26590]|uniref:FliM/FliN family flagellar motor switch protein n=1 Tax=Pseudomonas sp. KU26590 TaxID=2991051 RepID=UPI00223D7734|nr:FliM/FliN family flagellar motor switch protein [Pseudomonas sp. KU26590]UZJ59005.1 FliM/FliN family flagellar motor switch protein [Pseudomonas sp. KU26590]
MVNEELYEDEIEDLADDESNEHGLNGRTGFSPETVDRGTGFSREAVEAPDPHATENEWQDETAADGHADESYAPQSTTQTSLDSLDQLPMALTLRCGSLELTLGDLRRIAAGTVLPVNGVTPGFATLCHGERIVAEGELVSVEGRLGLQITRMASNT